MKAKTRQNKSISFKLTDAYELRLLTWAESDEHGDYSKYIKRLIGRDMEGQTRSTVTPIDVEVPVYEKTQGDFSGFI